jgi:hypothetical protein
MDNTKKKGVEPAHETNAPVTAILEPMTYTGPSPAPLISNLPCGCTIPANELSRDQQEYLISTYPEAVGWFS